jgi:aspartyl-tRNA(Asn)/glutamyl-tRNA(Gln) amidotransferase subunit C
MAAPRTSIDVQHVARLASLTLTDAEAARFAAELGTIVEYVAQLEAIDTSHVPAPAHVQLEALPWRDDRLLPCLSHDDALAQAPATEGDGFAVPGFVE